MLAFLFTAFAEFGGTFNRRWGPFTPRAFPVDTSVSIVLAVLYSLTETGVLRTFRLCLDRVITRGMEISVLLVW